MNLPQTAWSSTVGQIHKDQKGGDSHQQLQQHSFSLSFSLGCLVGWLLAGNGNELAAKRGASFIA